MLQSVATCVSKCNTNCRVCYFISTYMYIYRPMGSEPVAHTASTITRLLCQLYSAHLCVSFSLFIPWRKDRLWIDMVIQLPICKRSKITAGRTARCVYTSVRVWCVYLGLWRHRRRISEPRRQQRNCQEVAVGARLQSGYFRIQGDEFCSWQVYWC